MLEKREEKHITNEFSFTIGLKSMELWYKRLIFNSITYLKLIKFSLLSLSTTSFPFITGLVFKEFLSYCVIFVIADVLLMGFDQSFGNAHMMTYLSN